MFISKLSKKLTPSANPQNAWMAGLINSMADGVIAVDKDIHVSTYNGGALNILDRNDSLEGKPLADIFRPMDKENKPIDVAELVRSTKVVTVNRDLRLKYADGSVSNLYLSIAPVHFGYGTIGQRGYVVVLRDITREKSLEEERDEFISVVSHELRTPITISEGSISNAQLIVERSGDTAKVKQALEDAHSQILFLGGLINDLSTLARAERGKLTVEAESIDIHKFIAELVSNYRAEAVTKGLKLSATVDPAVTALHSSKLYVREILQNFITNSVKYTEHGSVTLSVTPIQDGLRFTVTDTGIGIGRADQHRVFDKFFRSEDYRTRKTNGTGLGLYVTAKLARLLGAKISLESELNKGSSFSVVVPNLPSAS